MFCPYFEKKRKDATLCDVIPLSFDNVTFDDDVIAPGVTPTATLPALL